MPHSSLITITLAHLSSCIFARISGSKTRTPFFVGATNGSGNSFMDDHGRRVVALFAMAVPGREQLRLSSDMCPWTMVFFQMRRQKSYTMYRTLCKSSKLMCHREVNVEETQKRKKVEGAYS